MGLQTVFDRAGRPPPGSTVHHLHGLPHKKRKIMMASTDDKTRTSKTRKLPIHYLNVTASLRLPYAVERWIDPSGGEALRIWAWDPFEKECIRAYCHVIYRASRKNHVHREREESVQYPQTPTPGWKSPQLRYLAELQVSWPEFGPIKNKYGTRDDNEGLIVTLSMLQLWPSQADLID